MNYTVYLEYTGIYCTVLYNVVVKKILFLHPNDVVMWVRVSLRKSVYEYE